MRTGQDWMAVKRPSAFAVVPQGMSLPRELDYVGHIDRFDLAVPLAMRLGVDVLVVSQRLVSSVDGWGALRAMAGVSGRAPALWLIADGEPAEVAGLADLAARVLRPGDDGDLAGAPQGRGGQSIVSPAVDHPGQDRRSVVVLGAKGGVGKTLVASNLGARLAASGARVALLDLDFEAGDLALRFGVTPSLDLASWARGAGHGDPVAFSSRRAGASVAIWAAPARPELAALASEPMVKELISTAGAAGDYLVIDTPSDPDSEHLYAALEDSWGAVLVTTLSPGSVRQAKVMIELLKRLSYPVRDKLCLVVNRVRRQSHLAVQDASDIIGLGPAAIVPEVPSLAEQEACRGCPTVLGHPRSPLARALEPLFLRFGQAARQVARRGRFGLARLLPERGQSPVRPQWSRARGWG